MGRCVQAALAGEGGRGSNLEDLFLTVSAVAGHACWVDQLKPDQLNSQKCALGCCQSRLCCHAAAPTAGWGAPGMARPLRRTQREEPDVPQLAEPAVAGHGLQRAAARSRHAPG